MNSPLSLQNIRHQIDQIDDEIHDLLMRRADLVLEIAEEKKKSGLPIIQPAREIKTLRRLMMRHRGVLQKQAVLQIWRELVGAVCLLQKDLRAVLYTPPLHSHEDIGAHDLTYDFAYNLAYDLAHAYLGTLFPLDSQSDIHKLISQLAAGDYECAILPYDPVQSHSPSNHWWRYFIDFKKAAPESTASPANSAIYITQKLPITARPSENPQAFLLTSGGFHASGDDYSILACESLSAAPNTSEQPPKSPSLAMLREKLGFSDLQLFSFDELSIIVVHEFVDKSDTRIQQARNHGFELTLLGGYPAPIETD